MQLDALGNCGGPAPGLLPILVGDPAESCPTAALLRDPSLSVLAEMVPTPGRPGALSSVPRHELPPDMRDYFDAATGWVNEFNARVAADRAASEVSDG